MFIVSGAEKLLSHYQNFLYAIQSYQILPTALELLVARLFPWIELFLGVFLLLGFWLGAVLRGLWGMVVVFMIVVSQALIRHLPITECGCFGALFSIPLQAVFIFDSAILFLLTVLLRHVKKAGHFGLDQYFEKSP